MKRVVLDSSALISLSESCAASCLGFLKEKNSIEFLAPQTVYDECVTRPLGIKQYGFSALRIKRLFLEGIVKKTEVDGLEVDAFLEVTNKLYHVNGKNLELIQRGEAECVVLMKKADCLVIDEKTLRILVESPKKMGEILKSEYGKEVGLDGNSLTKLQQMVRGIKILRSAEILVVAAKQGYFARFGEDEGEAGKSGIYALRGFGCSLTKEELIEFENLNMMGR